MKLKALGVAVAASLAMMMSTLTASAAVDVASVEISEANFPDDVFRAYVSERIDWDGDGALSEEEIFAVHTINVSAMDIVSLKGIEYFPELITLNCRNTKLICLDLSKNTKLETLNTSRMDYDLGVIEGCSYDLSELINKTGFDMTRTSEWKNAAVVDGRLDNFVWNGGFSKSSLSYVYDIGNGKKQTFNLTYELKRRHNYEEGVCKDCGLKKGFIEYEGSAYLFEITDIADGDMKTYLSTYEIYDVEGNNWGKLEVRTGRNHSIISPDSVNCDAYLTLAGSEPVSIAVNWYDGVGTDFVGVSSAAYNKYFTGEGYTYKLVDTKELNPLSAPTVAWDKDNPGHVLWELPEGTATYQFQLYYEDQTVNINANYYSGIKEYKFNDMTGGDFSYGISESGTYRIVVRAIGDMTTGNSECAEAVYEYTRPEEELAAPGRIWWTLENGKKIINWEPVAGASGYKIECDYGHGHYTYYVVNEDGILATKFPKIIDDPTWKYTIRAMSGNVGAVAHSSDAVTVGDYVLEEDVVKGVTDKIVAADANTIIADIEGIDPDIMADAMQNNSETLNAVKAAEDKYIEANGIEVTKPVVNHSKFGAEDIKSVVGAGLNLTSGSTIGIAINEVVVPETVDNNFYKNAIQLDISLVADGETVKGALRAPVTITMTIPEGVNKDRLVIIHFLNDGSREAIYPAINEDGTATFSTTSFSTFVFANIVYYDNNGKEDVTDTPDIPDVPDTPTPPTPITPPAIDPTPDVPEIPDYSDEEDDYDPLYWIKYCWNGKAGKQKVSGAWYYFDAEGDLETGWVQAADGKWYYMDEETCKMQTGWVLSKKSGLWYYMDTATGEMKSNGWLCDPESGRWYYLDANGAMCTSWIIVDNTWYLLDVNGAMCTGWNIVNGEWYLLGANGAMLTGWQTVDGKEYYLDGSGKCLMNTTTPDGFVVDENGAKIK